MGNYLDGLNTSQREAVLGTEGPSLVIAGAGSGKTRVLTFRIARLIENGVQPSHILSLTFTNKAAQEMKHRIGQVVGPQQSSGIWMGTFHSIFSRILRIEADKLGYTSKFTIYDTTDTKSLLKAIVKDLHLDEKTYKPAEVYGRISKAKNNLITAKAYATNHTITIDDAKSQKPRMQEIYRQYAIRCKKADAMDFDDLLLNTNILFRDFPDVLRKYQERFKYLLVDEYQDTNFSQYLIVKKLCELHKNVCVVGDDAQSIYSFRGARIENILNFKNDYKGYKIYKLEQNYRSTKTIVDAANSVIGKNRGQIQKKVWSDNETGEKIQVIKTTTDIEEGFFVSSAIQDKIMQHQLQYSDFAILYRTNAQSRIFEEALRKRNIPYKVFGSISFYQRKEIKDMLAYFRLTINNNDIEAFKRIVNFPTRGIGGTTLAKIEDFVNNSDNMLWDVLKNIGALPLGLNKGTISKIQQFCDLIAEFSEKALRLDAYDIASEIASKSGMINEYRSSSLYENLSKYENIQEVLNGIREFTNEGNRDNELVTLDMYMENVALLTDQDTEKDDDKNKVSIMTIHASKGLEFDYVFIGGLEENLFPSNIFTTTEKDIEEERRLFYVALTRAKKQAMLSYAKTRYKYGTPKECRPSRFIKEINPEFVHFPYGFDDNIASPEMSFSQRLRQQGLNSTENKSNFKVPQPQKSMLKVVPKDTTIPPGAQAIDNANIRTGMFVFHERFGKGKVVHLEGIEPNVKATVFFIEFGQKQLLLKFARLKAISPA